MKNFYEMLKIVSESELSVQPWHTEEDRRFVSWWNDFTRKFPVEEYSNNNTDKDDFFAGRIMRALDEIGETNDIWSHVGGVNKCRKNYYDLLTRIVEKNHPEMLEAWKKEIEYFSK